MPSSLLLFAALAQQTKQLSFMPTSLVLNARDPIRTAEEVALFDQMFPGRLRFSLARGYQRRWVQTLMQDDSAFASGRPEDSAANARSRARFEEYLDVFLLALTEDSFTYDGEHYQVPYPASGITDWPGWEVTRDHGAPGEVDEGGILRKIGVVPGLSSKGLPEMFAPYRGSEDTLANACRRGLGVLLLDSDPDSFRELCERYREGMAGAGREVGLGEKVAAVRLVSLGSSREEALDAAARSSGRDFADYFARFGFAELFRNEEDDPDRLVAHIRD